MRARETPVNMKEKYASVQAMKRGYRCVYVCVIINQISSRQLLVCVCYQSTPGRAVNARTICVCVFGTRKIKGGHECVYVCLSGIITLPSTDTCVRMCVYVC